MSNDRPHAKALDLPGWPCPPRVADIPLTAGSYGWISASAVAIDAEGLLWVEGDQAPVAGGGEGKVKAIYVEWCAEGLALYIPKDRYSSISTRNRLDRGPWIPVARILTDVPPHTASAEID